MVTNSTSSAFPKIIISGPPEERGKQYGHKAQNLIHLGIKNYKLAFAGLGISWDEARKHAASFIPKLEQREEELFTEIKGIAAGANVQLEEILALNCRTEIIYGHNADSLIATDGCTGAIALPSATKNNHLLHGQNWDWRDECADTSLVLQIKRASGPDILTQTEAGILARCGMNTAGIALTGNFLKCDRSSIPGGIPIPFVRRHILESHTLNIALDVALNAPKSFSTNLMISHAAGEAVNFETVPGETFWIMPENGLLVHANHFESIGALAKVKDEGLKVAPCSLYRSRRVREALSSYAGNLELSHFRAAFSDKFGSPSAVCADPDKGPGGENSSTVATILMDTTEQKMWIATRPYLKHTYTEYGFDD